MWFSELKNLKLWKLCRLYIAFAVVKLFWNLGDRNNYQSWFTCWTSFWDLKILEKDFITILIENSELCQQLVTLQNCSHEWQCDEYLVPFWNWVGKHFTMKTTPKKIRLHLINIIEDSFGFLCWLGLVNQRISSFIASAIKL